MNDVIMEKQYEENLIVDTKESRTQDKELEVLNELDKEPEVLNKLEVM
jgi:hypothetical protein